MPRSVLRATCEVRQFVPLPHPKSTPVFTPAALVAPVWRVVILKSWMDQESPDAQAAQLHPRRKKRRRRRINRRLNRYHLRPQIRRRRIGDCWRRAINRPRRGAFRRIDCRLSIALRRLCQDRSRAYPPARPHPNSLAAHNSMFDTAPAPATPSTAPPQSQTPRPSIWK